MNRVRLDDWFVKFAILAGHETRKFKSLHLFTYSYLLLIKKRPENLFQLLAVQNSWLQKDAPS